MTEVAKVFVRGLRVEAEVGLHAHERGRRQPLLIDVELEVRTKGGWTKLSDTADYRAIVRHAKALAAGGHVTLVESFAHRLAVACLDDPKVTWARIRVEKPEALAPDAAGAGVEIILSRD